MYTCKWKKALENNESVWEFVEYYFYIYKLINQTLGKVTHPKPDVFAYLWLSYNYVVQHLTKNQENEKNIDHLFRNSAFL